VAARVESATIQDVAARVLARAVRRESGCVEWTGHVATNGYGQIRWNYTKWQVHRAVWTATRGPIADDLTVDHLCRNPLCVNADHMEIVTRGENSRRAGGLDVANTKMRQAQTCRNGHRYDQQAVRQNRRGRVCATCRLVREQTYRTARRVAA
jgi:hypothetical protein